MANGQDSDSVSDCDSYPPALLLLHLLLQVAATTLFHLNLILIYAQRPTPPLPLPLLLLLMPIAIFRKLATAMARTFRIPDVAPGFWPGT